jgi:hypothetical protein
MRLGEGSDERNLSSILSYGKEEGQEVFGMLMTSYGWVRVETWRGKFILLCRQVSQAIQGTCVIAALCACRLYRYLWIQSIAG